MTNSNIQVSVVMATYNGERYLQEQLDSIFQQTQLPSEIVIIDDCSKDSTWEILEYYAENTLDVNVRLYRNEQNIGANSTFAKALKKAKGDLIFIADQDDVWLPEKINTMAEAWDGSDLISSDAVITDSKKKMIFKSELDHFKMSEAKSKENPFYFIFFNSISGHNVAITPGLVNSALPFPDEMVYDQWLAIMAHYNSSLQIIHDKLCLHRMHENNNQNHLNNDKRAEKRKHVHSKSIMEKKNKIYKMHIRLRKAMHYVPNHPDKRFNILAGSFVKHHENLDSIVFNYQLFKSLYQLRQIFFPNISGWQRVRAIRNLSVGLRGFWLKF